MILIKIVNKYKIKSKIYFLFILNLNQNIIYEIKSLNSFKKYF